MPIDKEKKFAASITVRQPNSVEVRAAQGGDLTILVRSNKDSADAEAALREFVATLTRELG